MTRCDATGSSSLEGLAGMVSVVLLIGAVLTVYFYEGCLGLDRTFLVPRGEGEQAPFNEGVSSSREFANQKRTSSVKFIIQHELSVARVVPQVLVIS